jgi:hypothetical protein
MDGKERKKKRESFSFCWRAHIPPRESLSVLFLISKEEVADAFENVRSKDSQPAVQSRPSSTERWLAYKLSSSHHLAGVKTVRKRL